LGYFFIVGVGGEWGWFVVVVGGGWGGGGGGVGWGGGGGWGEVWDVWDECAHK